MIFTNTFREDPISLVFCSFVTENNALRAEASTRVWPTGKGYNLEGTMKEVQFTVDFVFETVANADGQSTTCY